MRMRSRAWIMGVAVACGVAASAADRELVDAMGRRVRMPSTPRRVVALAPSITETIYSIGAGDAVVGVTDFTDWPGEAKQRPSVGGIVSPSIEKLVSLRPDVVIATREVNHKDTIDELDRLGVPVFVVDPQGLDGVLESVRQIGRALNRSGEANRLVDRLRARRDAVMTRVRGFARPRVLLVIWPDPVITIGGQAFITDVINAAGGQSVTEDLAQHYPQISLEEVLRRNPDWLLLPAGTSRSRSPTSNDAPAGTVLKPSDVIVFSTTTNAWTIPARVRSMLWKTSPNNYMRTRLRDRNTSD